MRRPPRANYSTLEDRTDRLVIQDLGPWDQVPTVTNDAEAVVEAIFPRLGGRRLLYVDSEGELGELLVRDGRFAGFAPASRVAPHDPGDDDDGQRNAVELGGLTPY